MGISKLLPIRFLYLLSFGFTAIATSPNIVSGLVVATTIDLSLFLYAMCQILAFSSSDIISRSEIAVLRLTSQLTSL